MKTGMVLGRILKIGLALSAALLMLAGSPGIGANALAADPIKVGYVGPLSGSLSLLGQGVRDGVLVYFAYVNEKGGVKGRKLELIAEDDAYDPMRTVAATKKLLEQDRIMTLLSPAGTAPTVALLPYVNEKKLPLLFPYAFSHALTNPTKPTVFTTLTEVRVQMHMLADYILNDLKQRKVAAIYQNDDFGQDAFAGLEDRFKKANVPLVKLPFDRGSTNFSGVVAQARKANVEHVVFLGIPRDAALVMKEASNMGWRPQFSGHNALGDPQTFKLAGQLAEGALAVAVMEPLDSAKPQVQEFLAHQKKYLPKTSPTTYSMHGYNAAKIFVEALSRIPGKDVTPEAIVNVLNGMKSFDTGLMGPVSFSKDQHAGGLYNAILKAKDGKW
jgi:ABC-type branched-subunit amino acid transport system substrate-binding protein